MYSLNGGATWNSYTGAVIISGDGVYSVTAKQTDIAGNTSPDAQIINITIDSSIPDPPVLSGITSGVYSNNQTFTVEGEVMAQLLYTIDGGNSWNIYSLPVTLSGENTYVIAVKQIDPAGNESSVSASVTLSIDKTSPDNVTSLAASADEGKVILTWNEPSSDDFRKVYISFSPPVQGVVQPVEVPKGTTTVQITPLQPLVTYNFTVKSVDEAGNESSGVQAEAEVLIGTGAVSQYTLSGYTFKMVYVKGGQSFPLKTDNSGQGTVSKSYWIGETEVSYALWSIVYKWATGDVNMNGGIDADETRGAYTMSINRTGEKGDGSGDYSTEHPVTEVNWREAVIWCNALTEFYNANNGSEPDLDCVYYSDYYYTQPLRSATFSTTVSTVNGSQDRPYIKASSDGNIDMKNCTSTGFRLPEGVEWECAARYIDGLVWTHGSRASGAAGSYTDAAATQMVAWYSLNSGADVKEVKGKSANALGLYDMSGNVAEWCFDWHPLLADYYCRMTRGGAYDKDAALLRVGVDTAGKRINESDYGYGFRITRTAK
jgi:formylglycine-generating enzyme required for sulfatase activity